MGGVKGFDACLSNRKGIFMNRHVLPGDPELEIHLKQSARARRMSLRVSRLDGRITLTVPRGLDVAQALAFAQEKQDWLRRQQQSQVPAMQIGVGSVLPVQGRALCVQTGSGRKVKMTGTEVQVPGAENRVPSRLLGHLKQMARAELGAASDRYASALGREYKRLSIRDTRSRWGSCTADGGLMYSWRLIMAPPEVLDYVAAHEVAHLEEMNHSAAFWDVVHQLYGDYQDARGWLREYGHDLHRYRFRN